MFIYLKRLISSKFVRVKAFPMYGGIGMSAPSLHRESTDSLIHVYSHAVFAGDVDIYIVQRLMRISLSVLELSMTHYQRN